MKRIRSSCPFFVLIVGFVVLSAIRLDAQSLFVSSFGASQVDRFNSSTGALVDHFATSSSGLNGPHGIYFGADHKIYVISANTNQIKRYNGRTGEYLGDFIGASGGLGNPIAMVAGPNGDLFVTCAGSNSIRRYDPVTGAFKSSITSGGINTPIGITLGPDNLLYVSSGNSSNVKRYDPATEAFVSNFASVNNPHDLKFGPDGNLYVSSYADSKVYKFNGTTGALIGTFASGSGLASAYGLAFGQDGNLYVCSFSTGQVKRFNGTTGAFIDDFASMSGATQLLFVPAYNVAPVANDDTVSTPTETPVDVDVLANDTDFDGDILSVSVATPPAHGTATVNADSTVHYVSDTGYVGQDAFTYSIDDGHGGTASATVHVTVTLPRPVISSLSPNPVDKSVAFTLHVIGSHFTNTCVIKWNGAARTTTFVSDSELTISVSKTDTSVAGAVAIQVTDPAPGGGGDSNIVDLTISAPLLKLTVTSAMVNAHTVTAVYNVANAGILTASNLTLSAATISSSVTGITFTGSPVPQLLASTLAPGESVSATVTFTDSSLEPGLKVTIRGQATFNTPYKQYAVNGAKSTILTGLVKSVTVTPSTVLGGVAATGTVTLNIVAPAGGRTVNLSSSHPAATVPSAVTVPEGSSSVTFPVSTVPVASLSTGYLFASAGGVTVATPFTVKPPVVTGLSFSPSSVKSGQQTTGTVTLSGPATAGFSVALSSANTSLLSVPASVTFAAGSQAATFIATAGSTSVSTSVLVTAQDPTGTSKSKSVTVNP